MKTFSWFYMCALALTLSACSTLGNQGSPCTDNANCQEGLKCLANHCGNGQQGSICEDDSHCLTQKSFFCVQQVCTRGVKEPPTELVHEPLPDASETVIADIQPEPSPEIPENIPETQIEPNTEGQQEPPTEPEGKLCTQEDDCPSGTYCLVREGGLEARCASAPPSCKRNADCATIGKGAVCRPFANQNNQIRLACLYPITTGDPIKQGGEPCTQDEECSSLRCLKEYNVCGAFCQQDTDCPNHFYCGTYSLFPHGEFQGCYPLCTSDSDCTEGYTCAQNRCIVSGSPAPGTPCRVDSDCGTNGRCISDWSGGYCAQSCSPSIKACTSDTDCQSDQVCLLNPLTRLKTCAKTCPASSACTFFQATQAYCLKSCQQDTDCRKDYYCGTQNDQVCLPRGNNKLGTMCLNNSDCEGGVCKDFASGQYCSQPCTTSCPVGFSCNRIDGQQLCEKDCFVSSDCADGYVCLAQRCQISGTTTGRKVGEACTANTHCQSGTCLNANIAPLFKRGYCSMDCKAQGFTCPQGTICISISPTNSYCVKSCSSSADCGRSDYTCLHIQVNDANGKIIPCSPSTSCPSSSNFAVNCHTYNEGSYCATGICLAAGAAPVGARCTRDLDCTSGFCYTSPVTQTGTTSCTTSRNCSLSEPYCVGNICSVCESDVHCKTGESCVNGVCTPGGYCASSCTGSNQCPQGSECTKTYNSKGELFGQRCLQTCASSLQCLRSFTCKQAESNEKVCTYK